MKKLITIFLFILLLLPAITSADSISTVSPFIQSGSYIYNLNPGNIVLGSSSDNTTATVQIVGKNNENNSLNINTNGNTSLSSNGLNIMGDVTGGGIRAQGLGIVINATASMVNFQAINTAFTTANSAITIDNATGLYITDIDKGVSATVTNNFGLFVSAITSGSTSNYAIYTQGGIHHFTGSVGIGTDPSYPLHVLGATPAVISYIQFNSSTNYTGFKVGGSASNTTGGIGIDIEQNQTANTPVLTGLRVHLFSAASAITIGTFYNIHIFDINKGSGSTITNNYGLVIDSITAGSTSNYAIKSSLGRVIFGDNLSIAGDTAGGVAGATSFSNVTNTTLTNAYTVKGGQVATTANTGWIKVYIGATVSWIPYWSNATP